MTDQINQSDWRTWLARQLTDPRLSDQEVASVVAWHPSISDEWKGCPGSTPPLPYAITFPPLPKGDK